MRHLPYLTFTVLLTLLFPSCNAQKAPDKDQLMSDVSTLASNEMEGRKTGTEGAEKARRYIVKRYKEIGILPLTESYRSEFTWGEDKEGINIVGKIEGRSKRYIIITAHYDHEGIKNGKIYNGADDNASGVAGLLAIAEYYANKKPENTILFVAFDTEESGLQGAKAFVKDLPVDKSDVIININMDMISRSDKNEIYAAGTHHYPQFKDLLIEADKNSDIKLSLGHDTPDLGYNDWTFSSDHGPFHRAGIPFIYFGVEDHPDYHKPTDDIEKINPDFLQKTVTLILEVVKKIDQM